jgi:2-haloalkanoic acid dehalogenase type II
LSAKPAAVVFDVDGTLVAFKFDVVGTRLAIIAELSRRGFDTSGLGPSTPTQSLIETAREQAASGRVRADFSEARDAIYRILDASEVETGRTATPFPGARQTLDYLRTRGLRLGVLTNSGRLAATEILARGGLSDCFEFVLCRDDVEMMKPRPDGLAMAVSVLGIPKGEVVYVGDSRYDIIAAKEAGVRAVGVASGNYSEEGLRAEGADAVIRSITDLPKLLGV